MATIKAHDTLLSRVVPSGLNGPAKPRHYREIFGVLWENRNEIPYAWDVLKHGVCDGCSLGKDISGCCPRNLWVIINRKGDIR